MRLDDAIRDFILACEADGLADATLHWYRSILAHFADGRNGNDLKAISSNDIRHYLVTLKGKYSDDSRGSYTRALHRFWKWSSAEYNLPNPMGNIRYPQKPKPKHRSATIADVVKMFEVANARDRAILAFVLDTGARTGGVTGLKMADVDMANLTAVVTEKGRKTRQVPFKPFTAMCIEQWLAQRELGAEYLFHNDEGLRLTPSGAYQMSRRLARRAGVKGRFSLHALRHLFSNAFYTASGGKYLIELARIMGHADMRTLIEHYVNRTDDHVRDAHNRYSPIDAFAAMVQGVNSETP
jgi:site-specific recombinase XerD